MTIRQSTGLRDHLQQNGSLRSAFEGGKVLVYSGSQPATAEEAPSGTLLCTFTSASGAHTEEVRATGTITITGTSGTITGITLGGVEILGATVTWATSNDVTAGLIAAQINKFHKHIIVTASSSGTVVTLTAARGLGASVNNMDLVTTESGGDIAGADVDLGDAVLGVASINGILFDPAATGALALRTGFSCTGVVGTGGTAGWFRLVGAVVDAGGSSTTLPRLDGSVATSGGDLNFTSTSFSQDATETISSFTPTEPAQA